MKNKEIKIFILRKLARTLVGKDAEAVVKALADKEAVRDDELSKTLNMNENEVRRILWKLSDHAIVNTRKVVNEDTGWISFLWVLATDQAFGLLYNILSKINAKLKKKLEFERENVFFWCGNNNCPKYTFDEATELMFRCKYCNRTLKPFDNSELIEALNHLIKNLEKTMEQLLSAH